MKVTLSREECIKVLEQHAILLISFEGYTASMSTGNYSFPHEVVIDILPTDEKPEEVPE